MKTVAFLIGYLLYPLSFLFPRSNNIWAFGSFRGAFNDNAKYLFIEAQTMYPFVRKVWISKSKETVRGIRAKGMEAYYSGSLKGLFLAMRAKFWFVNAYTSDILFFASGGAVCVNLWHGVGLKKIEFAITTGPLKKRFVEKTFTERFFHPESFRKPDFFLSPTLFQSVKFAEAFRIPVSHCMPFGYPRNSLLAQDNAFLASFVQTYEPEATRLLIEKMRLYHKVFIYMPTWRDSQVNLFTQEMDLERLNTILQELNALLLLKPHANTKMTEAITKSLDHIILIDSKVDVYPLLPFTHLLITDYSSILYDYILQEGKDVILYLYDYDEYVHERDFNYPFLDNVVGKIVFDFNALVMCLEKNNYSIDTAKRDELRERFWGHTDARLAASSIFDFCLQAHYDA